MKKLFCIFALLSSYPLLAQLPDTDIWLADIDFVGDSVVFSNPVNITNRTGYDSQPAFSPDGKSILYTSIRDDNQSDIYRYDLKTKLITQFTHTKTSEYSPTYMPDGKNISVVMVEADSTQRLWKFPLNGGLPVCIMTNIDSIGYHCWINKDSLALVMITEPPSLEIADVKTQSLRYISKNVGRCIQPVKNEKNVYFLKNDPGKDDRWTLMKPGFSVQGMPNLPSTSQDFYYYETTKSKPVFVYGDKESLVFVEGPRVIGKKDLRSIGINVITRTTISPDGKKIAFVATSKK